MKEEYVKKNEFIKYMARRRVHYMRDIAKEIKRLRGKQEELKEIIKVPNMTKENKAVIKNEIKNVDKRIKQCKNENTPEMIGKCLKQIENMKMIRMMRYLPEGMVITTEDVFAKKLNLGKYIIKIERMKIRIMRQDGISVDNYDRRFRNLQHTFVRDKRPCFGVWNPTIESALNAGGYYTIVIAALKLLSCTQTDDDGWYISPSQLMKEVKWKKAQMVGK